jgi:hypothetical protein
MECIDFETTERKQKPKFGGRSRGGMRALMVSDFQNCFWKFPFFLKENLPCCLSKLLGVL